MKLVIDANILFSALIKDGITRNLLMMGFFELYAPDYLLVEVQEHLAEMEKKTKVPKEVLLTKIKQLLDYAVTIFPEKEIVPYIRKSINMCPDPDDLPYFALALMLDCPIWSNDKELKQKQNVVKVYSTTELLTLISLQKP